MKWLLVTVVSFISTSAFALTISGGRAKAENSGSLSLLKVNDINLAKNVEQLSFEFGDKNGAEISEPGFYHIAIDEGGTRVVLDLSQVQQTSVDQDDLKNILKSSLLVKSAEITMDPIDQSTNITFQLKKSVTAHATAGAAGKILINLQEAK